MLTLSTVPSVDSNEEQSFAQQFSALTSSFIGNELDLSNATLIEVLRHHESVKKRISPHYSHSAVITLIEEINALSKSVLLPKHINGLFYNYLFKYLMSEKNLQTSSIKNYFDQISTALNWASKYNCPINAGYRDYNVKVHEREKYALTFEELCMIKNFDFRKLKKTVIKTVRKLQITPVKCKRKGKIYVRRIPKYVTVTIEKEVPMFKKQFIATLEKVRDMFVLSCCLFQRYSDMRKICPDNFSDDRNTYRVTQQKTGGKATVIISEISVSKTFAKEILEKYGYYAPYNKSINNYNKHLHQMLEIIGDRFSQSMIIEEKRLGEVIKKEKELFKCITSHTARRTAITLATKTNNEFKIRKASGHKDGRSFARYVIMD